jgi:DNA-binding transcriptional LysR family regulator
MDKRRRPPHLSLDLLRGFRAAARHLSFTRAADEIFVTQSAISREVKTLEDQIGQPLFQRAHRALQLTRARRR